MPPDEGQSYTPSWLQYPQSLQHDPKSIKYPRASQVRLAADDRSLKGKKGTSNSKRACVYDQKPKLRICLGQGRSARVSPTTHPPCYPFTLSIKRVLLVVGGNSVVFNFSPSSGIFVTLFPPFQFTRLIESDKTRHQVWINVCVFTHRNAHTHAGARLDWELGWFGKDMRAGVFRFMIFIV